jgi:hypothetical protein
MHFIAEHDTGAHEKLGEVVDVNPVLFMPVRGKGGREGWEGRVGRKGEGRVGGKGGREGWGA